MSTVVLEYVVPIIIGILSSLLASIMFLLAISQVRLKVEISKKIAKRLEPESSSKLFAIKVLNRGRRSIIAIQAQLYLVTPTQVLGGSVLRTIEIPLKRSDPLEIPKFDEKDENAQYAFRFVTYSDIDELWIDDAHSFIRFRMYGRDAVSGFGKVFTQDYHTKRQSLKDGDFRFGNSFEIE
jgi:hypothetical protein